MNKLIVVVILLMVNGVAKRVNAMTSEKANVPYQISQQPKTFEKEHKTNVLVDINVGIDGKVITTKLSQPNRNTSFNQLALIKAKNKTYPVKKEQGQAVEYWILSEPIKFSISPMRAKLPFNRKPVIE
ncbi:hypothetical protein AADZ91_07485 [Colwelliaceae bacterium 6441]